MIELIITMLFLIVFYRLVVELDRDIFDGIIITIWLGIMYYGKCWIDNKFK